MSTAIRSRKIPALLAVGALVAGAFAYQTLTKPNGDGPVRVVYRTEWLPLSQAAALVTYGPSAPGSYESRSNVKPVFERVRMERHGAIVELDVQMPGGADVQGWTCRIFVGKEAPKISRGVSSRCHVAKYVP